MLHCWVTYQGLYIQSYPVWRVCSVLRAIRITWGIFNAIHCSQQCTLAYLQCNKHPTPPLNVLRIAPPPPVNKSPSVISTPLPQCTAHTLYMVTGLKDYCKKCVVEIDNISRTTKTFKPKLDQSFLQLLFSWTERSWRSSRTWTASVKGCQKLLSYLRKEGRADFEWGKIFFVMKRIWRLYQAFKLFIGLNWSKVCTISFERLEASPWTFTVPVQLSPFHYLTTS